MDFKPRNMAQLMPYMIVREAQASVSFYEKAFGFKLQNLVKDDNGQIIHVEMTKDDFVVMFAPESADPKKKSPVHLGVTMPVNMYVYCQDTDVMYQQAIQNGAQSLIKPHDAFWGDRFCSVLDPDHYEWCFATLLPQPTP